MPNHCLSASGCRKQMASLALYLAKRRPISFPTKDVRTSSAAAQLSALWHTSLARP